MHEAFCSYKTAGARYCTCLHLVAMECCGHAEIVLENLVAMECCGHAEIVLEIVYAFQWIEKKVMKGSIKE